MSPRHARSLVASLVAVVAVIVLMASGAAYAQAPRAVSALPDPGFPVRVLVLVPDPADPMVGEMGQAAINGVQLAAETLAPDWDIDLVEVDSGCNGEVAGPAATQAIADGIHYIVGDLCSSGSGPVSEIAEQNGVLMITPSASDRSITIWPDGSLKEYVFRAVAIDDVQTATMAPLSMGIGGRNVAAMVNTTQPFFSAKMAQVFGDQLSVVGGNMASTVPYSPGDYGAALDTVIAAQPDAVFLPELNPATINEVLAAARAKGLDVPFLGVGGWDFGPDPDLVEGSYFATNFAPEDPRPVVTDFLAAYTTAYSAAPDVVAAQAYDAMTMLLTSISEAGEDDPTLVRDALRAICYEGVTGRMTFGASGDPIKLVATMTFKDGQRQFYSYVPPEESHPVTSGDVVTTVDEVASLQAPATLTQTLTITYTPQLTASMSVGDVSVMVASFQLRATDPEGNPVVTLGEPLTLTLSYRGADVAPWLESALSVMRWDVDAGEWVALEVIARDTAADTITVRLDHFSEFALFAEDRRALFVPVLLR